MQKGNIGVTTENIFPVIKKFLYSDHEIFLREMVSNAVDATQKMKTLAAQGEYKEELGDLTVRVSLDTDKGTITISDHGIGMTEEEIDKYINQGQCQQHHRTLRSGLLLFVHGIEEGGDYHQELQGRLEGCEVELRRLTRLRDRRC